jgi:predicted aspartyl protease
MGLFQTKLSVWNPAAPGRAEDFELWVDTGAAYSWLSRKKLEAMGIAASDRMEFRTIEGRVIERDVAPVFLRHNGRTGGDTVVLAEEGDLEVMGSHTLESLGLAADPVQKKLVRTVGMALVAHGLGRTAESG